MEPGIRHPASHCEVPRDSNASLATICGGCNYSCQRVERSSPGSVIWSAAHSRRFPFVLLRRCFEPHSRLRARHGPHSERKTKRRCSAALQRENKQRGQENGRCRGAALAGCQATRKLTPPEHSLRGAYGQEHSPCGQPASDAGGPTRLDPRPPARLAGGQQDGAAGGSRRVAGAKSSRPSTSAQG
jgi:hypothetical protein